jgi:hypothetical protein
MSETEYHLNEEQMLLLTMMADTEPAADARDEIVDIVQAWKRGYLLPKAQAPTLQSLYDLYNPPPPRGGMRVVR